MLLAVSALVLSLLQQIEEASHAEPPVFQVETLLNTAELLPPGPERGRILDAALRANAAVRDTESRAAFQIVAVRLLVKQDAPTARRLCRELESAPAVRCWMLVDEHEAVRRLSYIEDWHAEASLVLTSGTGARALLEKWEKKQRPPATPKKKQPGPGAEITRKMDRVDKDDIADTEKSRLLREVLEVSDAIEDITERLMHQGFITAWFAGHGEEGTAALAAVKLPKTFAEACRCEDGQCDSIAGRADCSSNIDFFVEYLAEQKIDPAILRIRHPSLAARALVVQLKEALK